MISVILDRSVTLTLSSAASDSAFGILSGGMGRIETDEYDFRTEFFDITAGDVSFVSPGYMFTNTYVVAAGEAALFTVLTSVEVSAV